MHGSALEDGRHSTPRPRLGWRFIVSLVIAGLLLGLMLGRLLGHDGQPRLERVETHADGLSLWFNQRPPLHGERLAGALLLHLRARGEAASGRLELSSGVVNWRLVVVAEGRLRLELLTARPLRGEWRWVEDGLRWRLDVQPHAE